MVQTFKNNLYETNLRKIATQKIFNGMNPGRVLELKIKTKRPRKNIGGHKWDTVISRYKVLNRNFKSILFLNLNTNRKVTFTFGDFITGDVEI